MEATRVLVQLIGSVALLLWGVRMVRTGVSRAFGAELRRLMALSSRSRASAFASGLATTTLLQSSTATALIIGSFAGRGLIELPAALAVMLGADVGSTLAAQLLAFDVKWLWAVLVAAGFVLFSSREGEKARGAARAVIGLGLLLLALQELGLAAAALRESPTVRVVLAAVGGEPLIALGIAALITWAAHSSLAIVLFVMSLAGGGIIPLPLALTLVLGANIGGAFAPWAALSGAPPAARRVPLGNLAMRGTAVVAILPFIGPASGLVAEAVAEPARGVVLFHTAFNLAVAAVGLPFVGALARLLERWGREAPQAPEAGRPRHLDASVLDTPSEALACAMRETLHMGDCVAAMLRDVLPAIEGSDLKLVKEIEKADDAVDRLHEAIKLYLVEASKAEMSEEESRRFVEILTFTTNLEHIGDIIDKNLAELAAKKIRKKLSFSPEGLEDLRAFHGRVAETMRLAFNVFATRDIGLARRLFADKGPTRAAERDATESHFVRLKDGRPESIETSGIHLDIIRDLKRIHGHLVAAAYPILEAEGELADTRLKARASAKGGRGGDARGGSSWSMAGHGQPSR
ncbi:Na/Pi cotransporter family protein [Chelatococcus sp. SYSU_G07232]|uniref:Na/Pi cotransporter family protein n=1 Tax=Chelatococcus albus TaxID=3047466 RepID=A0ABT7AL11_9HYPH|nr:Na/Pi cotransporter family protein [Chelatococcus sp. SYSU_G07232]MDJ1160064.1 Na/Pi cotransporter family protein [Chelatococcus sp. SYSU_G07232]